MTLKADLLAGFADIETSVAAFKTRVRAMPDDPAPTPEPTLEPTPDPPSDPDSPPEPEAPTEPPPEPEPPVIDPPTDPDDDDDPEPPEPVNPVPPPPLVFSPTTKPMLVRHVELGRQKQALLARLKACAQLAPNGTRESGNLDGLSKSGYLVDIGRNLALGVVPVLTALRYTGDIDLLYSVHRIMTNLRATLKENTGDGFRGWTGYFLDDKLQNSDRVTLEELLSWALVAQMTWAMR